ncbi:MAG: tRNA preQ1(34) S-adenosylmethionine ribosyltransferase-isomerase QueA [Desulfovibrionaceae bacterium]|nr:tRNA preQ1(34) S-adenosylmethionine ribosyltransferase-isomerase QueA [Desulfovibrionaceae bacterium]
MNDDDRLESYIFPLPSELIAQEPPKERGTSRMLVASRKDTSFIRHAHVYDLPDLLPKGALLVANNSKVLPARLLGRRKTGGAVEFLLLTPLPLLLQSQKKEGDGFCAHAQGLMRANSRVKVGDTFTFGDAIHIRVTQAGSFGLRDVVISWQGDLLHLFEAVGHIPLPPYIKRPDTADDALRYQTVYADPERTGSVAAPTAGLHFTRELKETLLARGFQWTYVTLYVGQGTFSPVRCDDIRDHTMHTEHIEIPEESAALIKQAKQESRPIIAIGTTTVRTLEGVAKAKGSIVPFSGSTDLFLHPGSDFAVVDGMLTNFHLPGSSLLMLVSAFAGREHILKLYEQAIGEKYRFFSYGDCMLLLP